MFNSYNFLFKFQHNLKLTKKLFFFNLEFYSLGKKKPGKTWSFKKLKKKLENLGIMNKNYLILDILNKLYMVILKLLFDTINLSFINIIYCYHQKLIN